MCFMFLKVVCSYAHYTANRDSAKYKKKIQQTNNCCCGCWRFVIFLFSSGKQKYMQCSFWSDKSGNVLTVSLGWYCCCCYRNNSWMRCECVFSSLSPWYLIWAYYTYNTSDDKKKIIYKKKIIERIYMRYEKPFIADIKNCQSSLGISSEQ